MIARTSIETYHDLRREGALGERQRFVLDLVRRYPGRTAVELTELAGFRDPNAVRPRLVELAKAGWVEAAGSRQCSVTGRMAMTWQAAGKPEQGELFEALRDHG
jgi:hypothetical protein